MTMELQYYEKLATAYISGALQNQVENSEISAIDFPDINSTDIDELLKSDTASHFDLHYFKRTGELPRVSKVLGMLRGLQPSSLLDIGSGRGVFLYPLLSELPHIHTHAVDINSKHVNRFNNLIKGGIDYLRASVMKVESLEFYDSSFEAVTLLEVLEHTVNPVVVLKEVWRVTEKYLILSVPSKEDTNPEHIHYFKEKDIRRIVEDNLKIKKINFDYVPGHMIALLIKE